MIKRWLRKWLLPDMYRQSELQIKINEALLDEIELLKLKNKKCQESINKTNSYYKGLMKSKKGNPL